MFFPGKLARATPSLDVAFRVSFQGRGRAVRGMCRVRVPRRRDSVHGGSGVAAVLCARASHRGVCATPEIREVYACSASTAFGCMADG